MPRRKQTARRKGPAIATKRSAPARIRRTAEVAEIDAIRRDVARMAARQAPRWNANPDDVRRSVLKLVLTLVELIRQLLERQAIRRMEQGTLTDEETEAIGLSLMRLQETILDLAKQFDLSPDELNLDLGGIRLI